MIYRSNLRDRAVCASWMGLDCPWRIVPALYSGPWRESCSVPCVLMCAPPLAVATLLLSSPCLMGQTCLWSACCSSDSPLPLSSSKPPPPLPWIPHSLQVSHLALALFPTPYPATIILAEFHAHMTTIPHLGPQVLSLFVSNKQFPLAQGIVQKKKNNKKTPQKTQPNKNSLSFLCSCLLSPRQIHPPPSRQQINISSPSSKNKWGFVICLTLWPEKSKSKQGLLLSLTPKRDLRLGTAPKPA